MGTIGAEDVLAVRAFDRSRGAIYQEVAMSSAVATALRGLQNFESDEIAYVFRIPAVVPRGKVLVHNRVSWWERQRTRPYRSGFRAWLDEPRPYHEECHCGWARHLNKHYVEKHA